MYQGRFGTIFSATVVNVFTGKMSKRMGGGGGVCLSESGVHALFKLFNSHVLFWFVVVVFP